MAGPRVWSTVVLRADLREYLSAGSRADKMAVQTDPSMVD
jgi:hypothetical protein